jgi:uncharacterized delta-60 repeat protein
MMIHNYFSMRLIHAFRTGFLILLLNGFCFATRAQQLLVDSSFGVNGVMALASTDTFCLSVPVFDFSTRIRALHNVYAPSQAGLNYQGVIQFKSSGLSIDSAFSGDGITNYTLGPLNNTVLNGNSAYDLKTIKDGRVLVAGRRKSTTLPYIYLSTLTCLKSNGDIDSSFATNGRFNFNHLSLDSRANDIHQNKENDRIVVHCMATNNEQNYLLAFKLNGTLDSSFGLNGKAYWHVLNSIGEIAYNHKPLYDKNEAIFIYRSIYDSTSYTYKRNEWLKLKPNGTPDSSFGLYGIQKTDTNLVVHSAQLFPTDFQTNCIDPQGNLYVFNVMKANKEQALVKYLPNGHIDSTFGFYGVFDIPKVPDTSYYNVQKFYCSTVLKDGSILIAGDVIDSTSPNKIDAAICRISYTGNVDSQFFQTGYFYRDLNNYNQDGFREIHTTDSLNYFFCGTAHKSALNFAQYYLAFKMQFLPYSLGLHTPVEKQTALIYPNPCNQWLRIRAEETITGIQLISWDGASIQREIKPTGNKEIQLNLSDLAPGFYMVRVQQQQAWSTYKIQIQR